jgi:hypothetical protein
LSVVLLLFLVDRAVRFPAYPPVFKEP